MNAKDFLKSLLYKRSELDDWVRGKGFSYSRYDQELGYLPRDRRCKEGMDGSVCTYTYDKTTGARRIVNFEGAPCRINTYGDSYTAGDQVNDGETWQEVLAAHLGEPIRNFGVGGYSVYQMFLRMKREEKRFPTEYMILNIYDDDHYRSLTGWQRIRFGRESLGPPTPYVEANPAEKTLHEYKNPCPEAKDLYDLCNLDWTYERFKDDFCMRIMLAKTNVEKGTPADSYRDIEALSEEHGVRTKLGTSRGLLETANALFARSATYASTRIVDEVAEFATREQKRTLYIASYGAASVANRISPGRGIRVPEVRRPGSAFNKTFVNFMRNRVPNYVDLMEAHLADYSTRKVSGLRYIKEYYVAPLTAYTHYNPLGNRFTAFSAKERLVDLLEGKPISYRGLGAAARNFCVNLD